MGLKKFSRKISFQDPVIVNSRSEVKSFPEVHEVSQEVKICFGDDVNDTQSLPSANKYSGLIFTLIASFFFSTFIAKILSSQEYEFHAFTITFWRYVGVVVPSLPILVIVERKLSKRNEESVFATIWPLKGVFTQNSSKYFTILGLVVRGTLGASAVILRYYSLKYLSIGDTVVISYATPIFVTVLAHFFLSEKLGVVPVIAAIITFCGVLGISRPPFLTGKEGFDTQNLIGISLAFGALVCGALLVIITRKIRKVHFSLMSLVFGSIGVVEAFSLSQIFGVFKLPSNLHEFILIGALMCLSFLAQMMIIMAVQSEQAGPVSLLRSCDVIYGFAFQFIFLNVIPDELSIFGAITIVSCMSVIGIRKWLTTLPENDPRKRKFRILLI